MAFTRETAPGCDDNTFSQKSIQRLFFKKNLSGKLKNLRDKNGFLSPLRGHKKTFLVFVILVTKAENQLRFKANLKVFQHLYGFPLSTNQLIKNRFFQLYFGSCLLIVRSCLRGWEPEETPLSARVSRSLSVSVRGRSLWSKIVLLLPAEEVMWWWKWRGGAEKGVRS